MTIAGPDRLKREDWLPVSLALGLAVVALLAGWVLKAANDDVTQDVVIGALTPRFPADWIVADSPIGDGVAASNPFAALEQYAVILPGADAISDAAVDRRSELSLTLVGFALLDDAPAPAYGATAREISYTFIYDDGQRLQVAEGLDRFVDGPGGPILITYQADAGSFEDGLDGFDRFTQSVVTNP